MEETLPGKGHGMTIVHHLGQLGQDPENLSKGQKAWGKSLPESLGATQQRILHDQTSSDGMTKHF